MASSTDPTIEHYQRPEVKAVILGYCMNGAGMRALNSDERWYKGGSDPKTVMLRGPADYDDTITRGRTLYATLDFFDPAVFEQSETWIEERSTPERPLGDLSRCLAFTLSADIDAIGDIKNLAVKKAVEAAAQFHADYLREMGIEKNVHCLYSGGGIYVHLHHALFAVDVGNTALTPSEIKQQFQILTKAYNRLIGDISRAFFRKHPEHIGKVKFDQLNNQKRTFKTIFSLHKRLPYAVIPLNPKAIKIDFARASLPLSSEVLAEGAAWYTTFDPSEKEAIVKLLKPKMDEVKQIIRDRPTEGNNTISRLPEPLDLAEFPPCMKSIIADAQAVEGRHRALGILATYLYQAGWDEDTAFDLWAGIADRCGVEHRIFETEFGRVSCPLCSTIQKDTGGYPNLNLFNLGFCVPDSHCRGCQWPGDYHTHKILNEHGPERAGKTGWLRMDDVAIIKYDEEGKPEEVTFSPTKAANAVGNVMSLAMSKDSEDIYHFNGQIYEPDGVRKIDILLCDVAADMISANRLKEVIRRVKNGLLSDPVTFDPNPYLLGVKNGVVDLQTGEFREYRPEYLITDQIAVKYDPAAKCPMFLKFLEEVEPVAIDRLMLVDWFAAHAIRVMFPYVMFLLGLGRNGKGIYERVLKRFFREESFSEMQLEELRIKNNRFAGAALKGKRGQIVSEAGEERKPGSKRTIPTNYLKFSTGDGTIDSDQKGTVRTRFKPFYKATVDTNDMPLITDLSRGWIERFCKVNMPYVFVDNPAPGTLERKKDPKLFEKLTTVDELSGILNLILARTPEIIKTGAITKRSGADMFSEYQQQSSSIKTFLDMFCNYKSVSDKNQDTFLDLIFEKYEEWCDLIVADKVDGIRFGKAVKTFCNGAESERIHDGDKKRRIYHGLSFDLKRYQAHRDHYQTIKGPLKTVPSPLGPLNDEYSTTWESLVKKYGKEIDETKNSSFFESMGLISIPKNANGDDIDFNGPENQFNGPDSDLLKTNTPGESGGGSEELQQAGLGPHPIREEIPGSSDIMEPGSTTSPSDVDNSEKIRAVAMIEYGMAGWVDPSKIAHALKLPLVEVLAWLDANYTAYDQPGGGIGYRQRGPRGEARSLS